MRLRSFLLGAILFLLAPAAAAQTMQRLPGGLGTFTVSKSQALTTTASWYWPNAGQMSAIYFENLASVAPSFRVQVFQYWGQLAPSTFNAYQAIPCRPMSAFGSQTQPTANNQLLSLTAAGAAGSADGLLCPTAAPWVAMQITSPANFNAIAITATVVPDSPFKLVAGMGPDQNAGNNAWPILIGGMPQGGGGIRSANIDANGNLLIGGGTTSSTPMGIAGWLNSSPVKVITDSSGNLGIGRGIPAGSGIATTCGIGPSGLFMSYVQCSPANLGANGITLPASGTTALTNGLDMQGASEFALHMNCTQQTSLLVQTYDTLGTTALAEPTVFSAIPSGAQIVWVGLESSPLATAGTAGAAFRLPQRKIAFQWTNGTATAGTCTAQIMISY